MKIPREPVTIIKKGLTARDTAMVIPETRVLIQLNGQNITSLVCRPENPEEPTIGLLHNYGVLTSLENIKAIRVYPQKNMVSIHALVNNEALRELVDTNRETNGYPTIHPPAPSTGLDKPTPESYIHGKRTQALLKTASRFQESIEVKGIFGAYHVAALANEKGPILCQAADLETDITVDRVFGKAFLLGLNLKNLVLLLSGRLRAGSVFKAARHGILTIMTFSVVSSLALEAAVETGLTLIHAKENGILMIYGLNGDELPGKLDETVIEEDTASSQAEG